MERKDIESQLHEQYAVNNNSKLGTVVTFIVAMFAVFGAYGYVYFYTSPELPSRIELLTNDTSYKFTIWGTLAAAFAVYFVLWIIFRICIYQGASQRMEQFITFAIRNKSYGRDFSHKYYKIEDHLSYNYNKIFPQGYHPFKKSYSDFVQGLYGEFASIIYVSSFAVIPISIILKLIIVVSDFYSSNINVVDILTYGAIDSCIIKKIMLTIAFILIVLSVNFLFCVIMYVSCEEFRMKYYEKYKRRNDEYVDKLYFDSKFYKKQQKEHEKSDK